MKKTAYAYILTGFRMVLTCDLIGISLLLIFFFFFCHYNFTRKHNSVAEQRRRDKAASLPAKTQFRATEEFR